MDASPSSSNAGTACLGRIALVTGASRGLGAAIARRLASEGARVAVAARTLDPSSRYPGSLRETVERIEREGGSAIAIPADLARPDDRARLVAEVERLIGPVDILVNNAAVSFFEAVWEFPEKRYRLMFEVHVRAAFELAQALLPGMRVRERGWILNISSVGARHPEGPPYAEMLKTWGGTVYGMCKAALERYSTGLAAEVYDRGVAVNALSPTGIVETAGAMAHNDPKLMSDLEPIEFMAEAALALCSGDPGRLTGRITYSVELLEELGRRPRTLDGRRLLETGEDARAAR